MAGAAWSQAHPAAPWHTALHSSEGTCPGAAPPLKPFFNNDPPTFEPSLSSADGAHVQSMAGWSPGDRMSLFCSRAPRAPRAGVSPLRSPAPLPSHLAPCSPSWDPPPPAPVPAAAAKISEELLSILIVIGPFLIMMFSQQFQPITVSQGY